MAFLIAGIVLIVGATVLRLDLHHDLSRPVRLALMSTVAVVGGIALVVAAAVFAL